MTSTMRALLAFAVGLFAAAAMCGGSIAQTAPPSDPPSATRPTVPEPATGLQVPETITPPVQIAPPPPQTAPPGIVPSPVEPSKPTPEAADIPPAGPPPKGPDDFVEVDADQLRTTFSEGRPVATVASGNVSARLRNMQVTAQRANIDYATDLALFEGNVVFRVDTLEVRGDRLQLNVATGDWSFDTLTTLVRPESAQGILRAPLDAEAASASGQSDDLLIVNDSRATTCLLPEPHYELVARSMVLYPGNKIVFRRVTPYVLDRRLFTIPRMVVPLQEPNRNPHIIPRFGQSTEEGYFLKTSYAYTSSAAQTGLLLLDLMTRKGIGAGIRHIYEVARGGGEVELYALNDRTIDQNTLTGRLSHRQRFGTLNLNLSSDFRSNSYVYAPGSESLTNRLSLTRERPGARSSLAINQFTDSTPVTRTSRLSGSLKHRQDFGASAFLDTGFEYDSSTFSGQKRARLTSQAIYSRSAEKFDWSISALDLADLSDEAFVGQGQFAGVERLPEIALVSDTARLGRMLPLNLPARLRLSFGQFRELPSPDTYNRTFLSIDTPAQRRAVSNTWSLTAGGGFRQYVYDSDRMMYSLDASAELRKAFSPTSSFALTYRFQRPRGFTPFRFDYLGRYNTVNGSLNLQDGERFRLSLLTGYNFESDSFPWQDVVLRAAYQLTPSFLLYAATGYDINSSQWQTLINQVRIRSGGGFRLDLGTRYDTQQGQLASVRAVLDTPLGSRMSLQALAGYNGISNDFDYRSLKLTRDLHCWEASLMYVDQGGFSDDRRLMFNLRIKAFPLFDSFGAGAFGQTLDTSVGQVF